MVRAIPAELKGKLEPAEVFHQLLEHRWFMSQREGRDVPLAEALTSYINDILRHRRDEATVVGPPTETMSIPVIRSAAGLDDDEDDEDDWRSKV